MKLKKFYIILLTAAMGLIVTLIILSDNNFGASLFSTITCTVRNDGTDKTISCWLNENDKINYIFLPAYTDLNQVSIDYLDGYELSLDNQKYKTGDEIQGIELNKRYQAIFHRNNSIKEISTLVFMKSQNNDTVYITTSSGSMEHINNDKNYKEEGKITVVTSDGDLDYSGKLKYIKGRGNTTWRADKKPYSIELDQASDLLNLGLADSWFLLGNYSDKTNIRNKLVYDFAKEIGLDFSPDSKIIDLYLNEEYMGIYLFSEKIEVEDNRVELGKTGVLLELETDNRRYESEKYGFTTDYGQKVVVHSDDDLSDEMLKNIQSRIQEMEAAIQSEDGINPFTGKHYDEYMDLHSWTLKYLLDEVFANYDCQWSSQFFFINEDGILSAGPAWDYDFSMGMPDNSPAAPGPCSFANGWREYSYNTYIPWYSTLYQKDDFYDLLISTYEKEVQPVLQTYLDSTIPNYLEDIKEASLMDAARWSIDGIEEGKQDLLVYLKLRSAFLSDLWVKGAKYHKVYFASRLGKDLIYNYAIKTGERIEEVPVPFLSGYTFEGWYDIDTGYEFDASVQIVKDTVVYARWTQSKVSMIRTNIKKYYEVLPVFFIGILFIYLFIIDIKHRMSY